MPKICVPADFCCPITTEMFVDPVIASDGHAYERSAIRNWFEKKSTSPATGTWSSGLSTPLEYTIDAHHFGLNLEARF